MPCFVDVHSNPLSLGFCSEQNPKVVLQIWCLFIKIKQKALYTYFCTLKVLQKYQSVIPLKLPDQTPKSMLDLSLNQESELKLQCKQAFTKVNLQQIIELSLELFPTKTLTDPIDLLFKNMTSYYDLKLEKKHSFDEITSSVLKKTEEKNKELFLAFDSLFKTDFIQKFKKRVLKSKGLIKKGNNSFSNQTQAQDNTDRKVIAFGTNSQTNKPMQFQSQSEKSSTGANYAKSISSKDSVNEVSSSKLPFLKEIKRPPLTLAVNSSITNNNVVTQSGPVTNLSDQDMCFCGKHVSLIQKSKEPFFECYYCKKKYHNECMKRAPNSKLCTFCHLRRLIPNRQTKKILFVGLLHKGRKRHQIFLHLTQQDLSIQYKIQVRSFRIKDGCQNFILFPDSCNFSVKNILLKEFGPLHRQSSLKYRKDEPFYLSTGMHVKENKILVTQKHPSKQCKDERIILETHLVGIYLIEQKKVDWLIRQMKMTCFTSFSESKELLEFGFKKGNIGDQITCEIIKIPLTCSLSTEKLKIPARGNFCTHFQCFDLKNFLQLISGSVNPRWLCPLCKIPAFQFKIDIILHQILQIQKQTPDASELVFMRTGEFKVFTKDEKECVSTIKNIHDLSIENKLKRGENSKIAEEDVIKKKMKPSNFRP